MQGVIVVVVVVVVVAAAAVVVVLEMKYLSYISCVTNAN